MHLFKPNVKRRKHFDVSLCARSNEDLGSPNDSNFVNNPTSEGLRSLYSTLHRARARVGPEGTRALTGAALVYKVLVK